MRYELLKPINYSYSAIEQILFNRGIEEKDFIHYLNTTDDDIYEPELLADALLLRTAASRIMQAMAHDWDVLIVVDSDVDGFTSSAILINYLSKYMPFWSSQHIHWFMHEGKQHGLADLPREEGLKYSVIICPDSASSDYEEHDFYAENNISVIVLDHHEAEKLSPSAIVINNQLSSYPNKALSGAGVTWQFCRFFDKAIGKNYAEDLIDLVALGLAGDCMSMLSMETKHLINKGLKQIRNPFIYEMSIKNQYSLGSEITPIGAQFYIVPFINAIVRSGTMEEKQLVFKSMLEMTSYNFIPSTKRGHAPDDEEQMFTQAVRVALNVKNRQTKIQDKSMELLENIIEEEDMLNSHKILLFTLESGSIDSKVAGLIANKLMSKYQRPCCILFNTGDFYRGSARGYSKSGVENFREVCEQSNLIEYAQGHAAAFGLSIPIDNIKAFLE